MAGQDFAHVERPSDKEDDSGQWKTMLLACLVVAGLIGSFFAGFYVGRDNTVQVVDSSAEVKALQVQLSQQQSLLEDARKALVAKENIKNSESETSKVGPLTFYTDLAKQKVMPAAVVQPKAEPAIADTDDHEQQIQQIFTQELGSSPATDQGQYVLQIASFEKDMDARRMQDSLQKKGLKTSVQKVNVTSIGWRYRVVTTHPLEKPAATDLQQQLKSEMKLSALMIRQ